tara:strand:- start:2985 stop:4760 length:1776 start_codon:yes stop_codon:yes gene_type:complete
MVKKKKSVERTKEDKSKILVKNNNNATNKNTNTQITQIIFPADMEIRTKKKKKKGKSTAQKKKEQEKKDLLEMLKSKLEEYDNIQEIAQQKKIPIPDELALSVISQEDLKTNEDIENYINDITQKINALSQLVNTPINPFSIKGFPVRMGSGTMNSGVILPPSRPQIINPSLIEKPRNEEVVNKPVERSSTPLDRQSPDRQSPENDEEVDNTKKGLEELTKELEDKIGKDNLPKTKEVLKDGDLIETQVKVGKKLIKFKAPVGFEDLFNQYKRYIENVVFITQQNQEVKGVYHIPLEKYNMLIDERDTLRKNYQEWFNNLPERLQIFMDTDKNVKGINADIYGQTEIEPKDLSKFLFQKENIEFTEITQGNEKPKIEKDIQERGFINPKDEKLRKEYGKLIAESSGKVNIIINKIKKSKGNKKKLDKLETEITLLQSVLREKYNSLPQEVKLSGITAQDSWDERFNEVRNMISQKRITTPVYIQPDPNMVNPEAVGDNLVKPNREKLTPEQKEAKKIMIQFIKSGNKKAKNMSPRVKTNIRIYFGEDKGNKIIKELTQYGNKTKGNVRDKKNRLQEFIDDGIQAQDVLGVM